MRPITRDKMGTTLQALVRDCLELAREAQLGDTDLATLLRTSRPTVCKWSQHMNETGDWKTLPISGSTPAYLFLNLLILRQVLKRGIAADELPCTGRHQARIWVRDMIADSSE